MNELSLFSGAGGGLLGTKLLGFRCVGYVEWEPYCQAVLAQRIADGFLEEAPIFGDIREFVKSGAAREYRGFADVVTAGFPCQPHSVAGKQLGAQDERDMWPATKDVIRDVGPRSVLLENVPGLITSGYIGGVLSDLAALGYVGRYGVLSAAGVGARHLRERLWIVAHAEGIRCEGRSFVSGPDRGTSWTRAGRLSGGIHSAGVSADTRRGEQAQRGEVGRVGRSEQVSWHRDWPIASEPFVRRGVDVVADRMDRIKALGNGQVPAVVVRAWTELTR